jgi:hypothetical protein
VDVVKKIWAGLRDGYGRALKKIPKTRSGQAAIDKFKPKWKFFNALHFLHSVVAANSGTSSNLDIVPLDAIENVKVSGDEGDIMEPEHGVLRLRDGTTIEEVQGGSFDEWEHDGKYRKILLTIEMKILVVILLTKLSATM